MEAAESANEFTRLQELGDSDFEVAEGQLDVRGWRVKNGAGELLGIVHELLFDVLSRKVRYLVLVIDPTSDRSERRKVLVPIGLAELHEAEDEVIVGDVTSAKLSALPDYEKGNVNPGVENIVRYALAETEDKPVGDSIVENSSVASADDFYNHHHFNDGSFNRRRSQIMAGKRILTANFDDAMEAEKAVGMISSLGISLDNINMSSARLADEDFPNSQTFNADSGLSNFIDSPQLLHEDESQDDGLPFRGISVTVNSISDDMVQEIRRILDESGAIEVREIG